MTDPISNRPIKVAGTYTDSMSGKTYKWSYEAYLEDADGKQTRASKERSVNFKFDNDTVAAIKTYVAEHIRDFAGSGKVSISDEEVTFNAASPIKSGPNEQKLLDKIDRVCRGPILNKAFSLEEPSEKPIKSKKTMTPQPVQTSEPIEKIRELEAKLAEAEAKNIFLTQNIDLLAESQKKELEAKITILQGQQEELLKTNGGLQQKLAKLDQLLVSATEKKELSAQDLAAVRIQLAELQGSDSFLREGLTEAKAEKQTLQAVIDRLRASFKEEEKALRSQLTDQSQELAQLKISEAKQQSALQTLQDNLQAREAELRKAQEEIPALQDKVQELSAHASRVQGLESQLQKQIQKNEETKKALEHFQPLLGQAQTEVALSRKELELTLKTQEQNISRIQAELLSAKQKAAGFKSKNEDLLQGQHALDIEHATITERQRASDATISRLSSELDMKVSRYERLETEFAILTKEKNALGIEAGKLTAQLANAMRETDLKEGTIKTLESNLRGIETKYSSLEARLPTLEAQLREGKDEIEKLRNEQIVTRSDLQRALLVNKELSEKLSVAKELEGKLTQLSNEKDAVKAELEEMRPLLETSQHKAKKYQRIKAEHETLRQNYATLEQRATSQGRELEIQKSSDRGLIDELRSQLSSLEKQKKQVSEELRVKDSELTAAKREVDAATQLGMTKTGLEKEIASLTQQMTPLRIQSQTAIAEAAKFEAQNKELLAKLHVSEQGREALKTQLTEAHAEFESQNAKLQVALEEAQQRHQGTTQELTSMNQRAASLTSQLEEARIAHSTATAATQQDTAQKIETISQELIELTAAKTRLESLAENNKALIKRLEDQQKQLIAENAKLKEQIPKLTKQNTALTEQLHDFESRQLTLSAENQRLLDDNKQLTKQVVTLQGPRPELESLKAEMAEATATIKDLEVMLGKSSIDTLEVMSLREEKEELESKVSNLKDEIARLKTSSRQAEDQATRLTIDNTSLLDRLSVFERDSKAFEAELTESNVALEAQIATLRADLQTAQHERETASNTLTSMKQRALDLEQKLKIAQEDHASATKTSEDSSAQIESMELELQQLESEKNALQSRLDAGLTEIAALRAKTSELQTKDLETSKASMEQFQALMKEMDSNALLTAQVSRLTSQLEIRSTEIATIFRQITSESPEKLNLETPEDFAKFILKSLRQENEFSSSTVKTIIDKYPQTQKLREEIIHNHSRLTPGAQDKLLVQMVVSKMILDIESMRLELSKAIIPMAWGGLALFQQKMQELKEVTEARYAKLSAVHSKNMDLLTSIESIKKGFNTSEAFEKITSQEFKGLIRQLKEFAKPQMKTSEEAGRFQGIVNRLKTGTADEQFKKILTGTIPGPTQLIKIVNYLYNMDFYSREFPDIKISPEAFNFLAKEAVTCIQNLIDYVKTVGSPSKLSPRSAAAAAAPSPIDSPPVARPLPRAASPSPRTTYPKPPLPPAERTRTPPPIRTTDEP